MPPTFVEILKQMEITAEGIKKIENIANEQVKYLLQIKEALSYLKATVETMREQHSESSSIFNAANWKKVMNLNETSTFTQISKSTLYKLTSQNRIPHYHRGRKLVFLKSELEKWMLENPVKTIDQLETEASSYVNKPLKNGRNR